MRRLLAALGTVTVLLGGATACTAEGGPEIVVTTDILGDVERLVEWWGEVYLSVRVIEPGGADGLGRRVAFHSRGWLPYTLRWTGRVVAVDRPHGWTIEAEGDLAGRGVWTFDARGATTRAHYVWTVDVEKPVLRWLTPILAPVYAANHRWAMARGLEGLRREILRRRAGSGRPLAGRGKPS